MEGLGKVPGRNAGVRAKRQDLETLLGRESAALVLAAGILDDARRKKTTGYEGKWHRKESGSRGF